MQPVNEMRLTRGLNAHFGIIDFLSQMPFFYFRYIIGFPMYTNPKCAISISGDKVEIYGKIDMWILNGQC